MIELDKATRRIMEDAILDVLSNYSQEISTDQYGYDYRTCCGGDLEFPHLENCDVMLAIRCAEELFDNNSKG